MWLCGTCYTPGLAPLGGPEPHIPGTCTAANGKPGRVERSPLDDAASAWKAAEHLS